MADFDRDSMLEMFIYEMTNLLEQLEGIVITGDDGFDAAEVNEIFRIMHTIKGSAAMMMFNNISVMAHRIEDIFFYLREENPSDVNNSKLADLTLESADFIKTEIEKIENGEEADGDPEPLIEPIEKFLSELKGEAPTSEPPLSEAPSPEAPPPEAPPPETKPSLDEPKKKFKAIVYFAETSEMPNVRAYILLRELEKRSSIIRYFPEDLFDEINAPRAVAEKGFEISFSTNMTYDETLALINKSVCLESVDLEELDKKQDGAQAGINKFEILIKYDDGAEMENVRAFALVNEAAKYFDNVTYIPKNLEDSESITAIKTKGLKITLQTNKTEKEVDKFFDGVIYLKEKTVEQTEGVPTQMENVNNKLNNQNNNLNNNLKQQVREVKQEVKEVKEDVKEIKSEIKAEFSEISDIKSELKTELKSEIKSELNEAPNLKIEKRDKKQKSKPAKDDENKKSPVQKVISVNVSRLDHLLNLMGELVIAEAMVTQNPDLEGLDLERFDKEARQLRKIIVDVQDTVMSMRMVPLSATFFKMQRIVRDMCKTLNKEVALEIVGEETEVDKNIIENISDPLMHIIRNSLDHGIELPKTREAKGKKPTGKVILEAKNSGGEVVIAIRDDGAGLNTQKILEKAKSHGLLEKPEEDYTEKEINQFIFLPGFSTNDVVTGYSGRGVGMDVVVTNLESVGGTVYVESVPEVGASFIMKIPLTLAIIEGMNIKLGESKYTIPIVSIKQSFNPKPEDIFQDPNGNEMITVRGELYNVVRLAEFFEMPSSINSIEEGTMIMIENGDQTICLLADELVGQQQVVVKTMPKYIKKIPGISGCTLLGNGEISLIIDVAGFFDR